MSGIALTLCGRVAVTRDGEPPSDATVGVKCLALLAYLALESGPHSRDELTALLWGEYREEKAKASLRQALTHLRQAVGDILRVSRATVEIAGPLECDALTFLRAAKDDWRAAVRIEIPQFLAGLQVRNCPAFDEWAEGTRRALLRRYQEILAALSRETIARREWREACDFADRWLATDPLSDEAVRMSVNAHFLAGERDAALTTFAAYRDRLAAETGEKPSSELQELAGSIERDVAGRRSSRATEERYERAPTFEASLRGRTAEWEVLRSAWNDTMAGRGRVVLIEGEAGVGKSRLASDFLRWVTSGGGMVLRGRGYEAGTGIALGTVVELLHSVIDAPGVAGADPQWLAETARLVPELRRHFPALPDVPSPEPADGWRLFEGVAQVLLAVAEESPVAAFIDDLHWCDGASCNMLHFLVRRLEQAPVLWCATVTLGVLEPDTPAARLSRALRASPHSAVLSLAPLSGEDVWQMIRELGRVTAPTGARRLAGRIHEVTAGNPFYVIELLKMLFAQGWLIVDPRTGEWIVRPPLHGGEHALAMAPSVHEVIGERIDCLPDQLHAVLVTIAIAGRGCGTSVLSHVHGISRLRAAMLADALVERHLAVEERGVYRCAHPVIARVVRDALSTARRREVHRSLALSLVRVTPSDVDPADPGEIALHAEQGGLREIAYKYAIIASRVSMRHFAYEEALAWLDLAATTSARPQESSVVNRMTAELLDVAGWRETRPSAKRATTPAGQVELADVDLPGGC